MQRASVAVLLLASLSTGAQTPTERPDTGRNGRWGISGAGEVFIVPYGNFEEDDGRDDRTFFAASLSLRWAKSARTTWRLSHARSLVSTATFQFVDGGGVHYEAAHDLWLNDTRIELLMRRMRCTRNGRGPYLIACMTFRAYWMRFRFEPDTQPIGDFNFDYEYYKSKTWEELYARPTLGLGYDRRIGPLDLFAEACAEFGGTIEIGGGESLSVRPRVSLGLTYRFGRPVPALN